MVTKRVFLLVLDSFGVGELPDAAVYGDQGSHTLRACLSSPRLHIPNMARLGLFNIDDVGCGQPDPKPLGAYGKMAEASYGKDTTIGHWELAGLVSENPMPTYPNGFPLEVIEEFTLQTGKDVLCNQPASGMQVLDDYGRQHQETGDLIVYTSADSVFQIAAHEQTVPLEELYRYCRIARGILTGEHAVGRVIARPFTGKHPTYTRTAGRQDFSLEPPLETVLDRLAEAGKETIGVGKIHDIFAGRGLKRSFGTKSNYEGMNVTAQLMHREFEGFCFVNLVDFDMLYGHRNDVDGYADALTAFDRRLAELLRGVGPDDLLFITADHGCDPLTPSTDHSREYVPLLAYGPRVVRDINLGVRATFADVAATVAEYFEVEWMGRGTSFLSELWG